MATGVASSSSSTGSNYIAPSYATASGIAILTATVVAAEANDIVTLAKYSTTDLTVYGRNTSLVSVYEGIPYMDAPARWSQPIPASIGSTYAALRGTANQDSLKALGVPTSVLFDTSAIAFSKPRSEDRFKCYQRHPTTAGLFVGSEDCLYMNIATPYRATSEKHYSCNTTLCTITSLGIAANAVPLLPVMVFIHGGNYANGSAYDVDVESLVRQSVEAEAPIVAVTFNYRIGVFGFLAHSALSFGRTPLETSGLYALEDQRMALRFVRSHIQAFGGDPSRVTLVGEGTGAVMACMHVFSDSHDKFNTLFARAILQGSDRGHEGRHGRPAGRCKPECRRRQC